VDFEIVLVEWRAWSDRPWLSTLLADAFPDLVGHARIASYVVDGRYHSAFGLNGQEAISDFIALNVGIRRARAPFILTTRRDIYFSRQLIERMRPGMLRPSALYRAIRIGVSATSLEEVIESDDRAFEDPGHRPGIDGLHASAHGFGHFLLMGAEAFGLIRGFNEIQRRAPIHLDQNFCLKVRSMGVPILDFDEPVYDFGSGTPDDSAAGANLSESTPEDRSLGERIVYQNHDDWGLRLAPETRVSDHTTFLEFDWRAVPPLIDLNRLSVRAYRRTHTAVPETTTRDEVERR